jgi:leucyl aminopeptidase (aminopeptidase T)
LRRAAENVVRNCLDLGPGESLLIITDAEKERFGQAVFNAGLDAGVETMLVKIPVAKGENVEPPAAAAQAMREVDAIVAITKHSISHTKARKKANGRARIVTMPDVIEPSFMTGGLLANYATVANINMRLFERMRRAKTMRIITHTESDLIVPLSRARFAADNGLCNKKGMFTNLPAGELIIIPREGVANGSITFDTMLGDPLKTPVKVAIAKGRAASIEPHSGRGAQSILSGRKGASNLVMFGIGTNPNATICGHPLEDFKVLGNLHVAFGDSSRFGGGVRSDIFENAIAHAPTIEVDGEVIIKVGRPVI